MYKILSLAGGGVRGLLSLDFLIELEKQTGRPVHKSFDLIVGTSVGALIGANLTHLSANYTKGLLANSLLSRLFKPNLFSFGGLIQTKYNTESKLKAIREVVPDAPRFVDYAFPAFDIKSQRPVIFNSLEDINAGYVFTTKFSMKDAVCASTAVPILWNPYGLLEYNLVDGAFVANSPDSIGIKLALDKNKITSMSDILLVSVGTGVQTRQYNFKSGTTPLRWMIPTFMMLLESSSTYTKMLYHKEGFNYFSFDTNLNYGSDDIDDISSKNLLNLEKDASNLIFNNQDKISKLVKLLK